jgi:hypothetical protein
MNINTRMEPVAPEARYPPWPGNALLTTTCPRPTPIFSLATRSFFLVLVAEPCVTAKMRFLKFRNFPLRRCLLRGDFGLVCRPAGFRSGRRCGNGIMGKKRCCSGYEQETDEEQKNDPKTSIRFHFPSRLSSYIV